MGMLLARHRNEAAVAAPSPEPAVEVTKPTEPDITPVVEAPVEPVAPPKIEKPKVEK